MENKKIFNNINVLKLILVLVIVYYHIIAGKLAIIYPSIEIYSYVAKKLTGTGGYAILGFFIIAGYFLNKSINKKEKPSFYQFVTKKIIRFFPLLFFSTFLCICLGYLLSEPPIQSMILNMFFIHQYSGGAQYPSWNGSSWFLCCLFWVSIFYYLIVISCANKLKSNFLIFLISLVSLFLLINPGWGKGDLIVFGIIPYRDLIGLCGIGFGYILGNTEIENIQINLTEKIGIIFIGILELILLSIIILPLIFNINEIKEPLLFILCFMFLLLIFIKEKGIISKFFNNIYLVNIAKTSFSIYIMQEVCFIILQVSFWKTSYPISHPVIAFIISFVFCIFVGVVTHIYVEKPVTKYLENIRGGGIFQ